MADGRLCAYCRKRPVSPEFDPFCSERCRMADLGRWLSGDYRMPGEPLPTEPHPDADDDDDA